MIRRIRTAIAYYTRIPVRFSQDNPPADLDAASVFLPLIGVLSGLAAALGWYFGNLVAGPSTAAVLALVFPVLLTGALHEDGFADSCDGFGGGFSKEDVLRIMKDSRSGAFAVTGLILLMLLKYSLFREFDESAVPAFLLIHIVSRLTALIPMALLRYARAESPEESKVGAVSRGLSSGKFLVAVLLTGVLLALLSIVYTIPALWSYYAILGIAILPGLFGSPYFAKRIGGFTGDTLGAVQQLSEVFAATGVLLLWS